ncbi:unnamed protein product (macronuclear) [Paramecium tetraurelia]|uniref:Uncharacterized protein n=1 Tax=Paramecium tetraurelia TaxID=5888 RepID=A0BG84_PARTE|nr:uncharacterized protein GSPATT00028586001 [Paramecium tetraurelia]CAK57551.1 unnamed protein product [Paramecium tetraurelia]|eukprot:XP_001424949.1 hypothetical protein (macronuclear) [Paramecium tetraurelia strain d4-2]
MLKIEEQNYSRQLIKQDKELSQFIKYLEMQNDVAEKNKEKEFRMKQKESLILGQRQEKKQERDFQARLKQLELSTIREKYDESQMMKNQSLEQKLKNQESIHNQILQAAKLNREDKANIRNLHLRDSVDQAIAKANQIQQDKVDHFNYQQIRKDQYLSQIKSEKNLKQLEKSMNFQIKQELNDSNYKKAQDLLNERIYKTLNKLDQKDSLSQQIQIENQRKLNNKLFSQKASLENGLTNADYAKGRFEQNLNMKKSMTEYKMNKLDQMMREKQLLQQQERETRVMVEKKKYQLKEEFERKMNLLQKQKY